MTLVRVYLAAWMCRQQRDQQGVHPAQRKWLMLSKCYGKFLVSFFPSYFPPFFFYTGVCWGGWWSVLYNGREEEECRPHYPTERDRRPYGFVVSPDGNKMVVPAARNFRVYSSYNTQRYILCIYNTESQSPPFDCRIVCVCKGPGSA